MLEWLWQPIIASTFRHSGEAYNVIRSNDGADALAGAPAPAALTDVAALAATVSSSDGLAAVVSSTSGLAADDCRNLNAVLDNINTAFIGPQRTAVVGPVSVAYRRFGPLRSSERLQKPLVRPSILPYKQHCPWDSSSHGILVIDRLHA